jgi:hypothetical protein
MAQNGRWQDREQSPAVRHRFILRQRNSPSVSNRITNLPHFNRIK